VIKLLVEQIIVLSKVSQIIHVNIHVGLWRVYYINNRSYTSIKGKIDTMFIYLDL